MTEEKKTYLQHAFRYGTIIGFISFVYYLIGFYTELEKHTFLFDNIYFFISIVLLITMMVKYRRMQESKVKFWRYMTIGFVASVVISFFISAYVFVRIMVLDPFMVYNIASMVEQSMKAYSIDFGNEALLPVLKGTYVFANFLVGIFNNMVYILLISLFMTMNNRIYNKKQ